MSELRFPLAAFLVTIASACSSSSSSSPSDGKGGTAASKCEADTDCSSTAETPLCDLTASECVALPAGNEIGYRDGSAASVTFTEIGRFDNKMEPVDLGFHPERADELWVVGYGDDTVQVGIGVGAESGTWKKYHDPAAGHFMHKPPAIAWGSEGLWGTCGDNDNSQNDANNEPNFFMGPALFTSDLAIFTTQNKATKLGSHYDMLHNTSDCRGIAHEDANVFWAFNGELGSLDKYNFGKTHPPGEEDHSDGQIYRYALGQVKGLEGVPSHVAFDPDDKFLYVADTGNKRIVRLDTTAGTLGGPLPRRNEQLAKSGVMKGTQVEEVVAPGTLEQPSGLEIKGGLLYVTDAATSTFHVFDKSGTELRTLATDLPAGSLAGFTFGPAAKIYFTDKAGGRVLRIDPQ